MKEDRYSSKKRKRTSKMYKKGKTFKRNNRKIYKRKTKSTNKRTNRKKYNRKTKSRRSKRKTSAKYERCVRAVKKKQSSWCKNRNYKYDPKSKRKCTNPWAVCTVSVGRYKN